MDQRDDSTGDLRSLVVLQEMTGLGESRVGLAGRAGDVVVVVLTGRRPDVTIYLDSIRFVRK